MVSEKFEKTLLPLITVEIDRLVRDKIRSLLPEMATKMVQEGINCWVEENQKKLEQKVQEIFAPSIHKIIWELAQNQVMQDLPVVAERFILEELHRLQYVEK